MGLIKTPLRYPGGKSRVAELLVDLMPQFSEYREPFLGGGSVFLTAKQKRPDAKFWVNDLYYDLWCFWYEAKRNMPELVKDLREMKENFKELGGRYLHDKLVADMPYYELSEKARAFFALNRITFSGTSLSGGYSEESWHKRFTPSSIDRLEKIGPLLEGVDITNLDFSDLLVAPGDDVFIFLDPPYYSATKSALYGKNGELHKGFDHERLADELSRCEHRWMMTYDNSPYITNLYSKFNIIDFELAYGMRNTVKGNDMVGKEVLITNYKG